MIQDSDKPSLEVIKPSEPSNAPSQPQSVKLSIAEVKATHEMLVGFREGIREGTFQGKHLTHIAMGLNFLDNMVNQSNAQIDMIKRAEKDMRKQALDAIKEAGGKTNGESAATSSPETAA